MEREETEEKESVRKVEKERYEMKYKVGDKVRVRSDLKNSVLYGGLYAVDEMLKKKIVTIKSVHDNYYKVVEDDYKWTDEMLEGLVEDELTAKEAIRLQGEICVNNMCSCCPIGKARRGIASVSCDKFREEYPEKALEAIKQWKADHEKEPIEMENVMYIVVMDEKRNAVYEEKTNEAIITTDMKKEVLKKYCSEHDGKYYAISERRCVVKE